MPPYRRTFLSEYVYWRERYRRWRKGVSSVPNQGHEPPGGMYRIYFTVQGEPMQHYIDMWAVSEEQAMLRGAAAVDDMTLYDDLDRQVVQASLRHTKIGEEF